MKRFLSLIALLIVVGTVQAHGPSRQKVTKSVVISAPAAEVWKIIADFCAIATWHPGVAKCDTTGSNEVGARRTLRIGNADGPKIVEELQLFDAATMTYKYKILETDNTVLPVSTYSGFLSVKDNGDNTSTAEWRSGFYRAFPNNNPPPELSDAAAVKAVGDVYDAGLANLKKLAEGN